MAGSTQLSRFAGCAGLLLTAAAAAVLPRSALPSTPACARCQPHCALTRLHCSYAPAQVALKFEHNTSKGCTPNGPPYEWSVYA